MDLRSGENWFRGSDGVEASTGGATGEESVLRFLCHLARQQQGQLNLLLVVAAQALTAMMAFPVHKQSARSGRLKSRSRYHRRVCR